MAYEIIIRKLKQIAKKNVNNGLSLLVQPKLDWPTGTCHLVLYFERSEMSEAPLPFVFAFAGFETDKKAGEITTKFVCQFSTHFLE